MTTSVSPTGRPRCCYDHCEGYAFYAAFPGHLFHLCAAHIADLIHGNPGRYFYLALTPLHATEVLTAIGRTGKPSVKSFILDNSWNPNFGRGDAMHAEADPKGVGLRVSNPSGVALRAESQTETKEHKPVGELRHEFSPLTGWCYHCGVIQSHYLADKPCPGAKAI